MGSRFTVVVSPREQFSKAIASLESVFSSTSAPFDLIYVDGNSPKELRSYLETQARLRGFTLISVERYLAGNEARNLGLEHIRSEYVIFIDNDVIVAPGCFEELVHCSQETGAAVVGPLYLNGDPGVQTIHTAGADLNVVETNGQHYFHERHHLSNRPLSEVKDQIKRGPIDLVEFHCLLARRDLLDRIGPLDEGLVSFFDHIDFCMSTREVGESVYLEPSAVVTHLAPPPFESADIPYFLLRWSDAWLRPSLARFAKKRDFDLSEEFINAHLRYRDTHRRRLLRKFRDATRTLLGRRALAAADLIADRLIFDRLIERGGVRRLEQQRVHASLAHAGGQKL
jgi:GT2 family glycosyltransferase